MTAIQFANDKPTHACHIKLSPSLHHVESREANNMPEGICGRGIRDLNGTVQLPLVTERPLYVASHTPAAQGLRKRVGMGKHRRFKSWNHPQLQIVMDVFADNP